MGIYFLRNDKTGDIKIGTSRRIQYRCDAVTREIKSPTTLLGQIDGKRDKELELHRQFAHLRIEGEWFKPGDDLLDFIRTQASPLPSPKPMKRLSTATFPTNMTTNPNVVAYYAQQLNIEPSAIRAITVAIHYEES